MLDNLWVVIFHTLRVRGQTCDVAEVWLGKIEQVCRRQHAPTLPMAAPVQVPSPNEVSIKQHLYGTLMDPNHSPPATKHGCACMKQCSC